MAVKEIATNEKMKELTDLIERQELKIARMEAQHQQDRDKATMEWEALQFEKEEVDHKKDELQREVRRLRKKVVDVAKDAEAGWDREKENMESAMTKSKEEMKVLKDQVSSLQDEQERM